MHLLSIRFSYYCASYINIKLIIVAFMCKRSYNISVGNIHYEYGFLRKVSAYVSILFICYGMCATFGEYSF